MPARWVRLLVTVLAVSGLLSGCSGEVPVAVPEPALSAAAACEALSDALPDTVRGQDSRPTDPRSPFTAAWGDPPITLRCGVERPAQLTPTSDIAEVDGVAWLPVELTEGYRFVTTGRFAFVEVDVPDDYAPEVDALVDLAEAVAATIPLTPDPVT